ncbi:ZC21C protein, partial [Acromyrmex heyeri]
MHIRSQQLGTRGVSMDMKTSWTAPEHDSTFPSLETMARFQQKQLQEKEQKLLQLYDQQQQRAYQVVQRSSAGSNGSGPIRTASTTTTASHTTSTSQGGKVRQMFDERRQTTVKGIDRSYPLEPLENKLRKQANTNGVASQRNGNVTVNRQSVKRVSRADVNSNVNGGKPVVSYHEEIIRESFGPSIRRHDDEDEYGVENRIATFANGHYRHEADNEQEEALDQETVERNRMMAKIHLMGFDETLKHRVRNDLESEEFPEYLMVDVPDKLSKRNVTKKVSQAEERLERFKNANAKRSNMPKQATSTNTVIKKRSEQVVIPTKSNSRVWSEVAGTSPTNTRSGSSLTSERSQRILENINSPLPTRTRIVDEMSSRRRESSGTETLGQRTSPRNFLTREAAKAKDTSRIYPRLNEYMSLTSDGKIFIRRSVSPRFLGRESKRPGTTMSIDRKSDSSGSPLFYQETSTKHNRIPFFLNESRKTNESKSSLWSDRGISSKQSTNSQYFSESKRSETAMSTDRETIESKSSEWSEGTSTKRDTNFDRKEVQTSTSLDRQSSLSKSPLHEEKILKRRSISPQFFCKESERSATTMSIDRATSESKSSLYDHEIVMKRSKSPRFSKSEQSRKTSVSKSPAWNDRGISSRQSTSPQYFRRESKRSATAMKKILKKRNTSPQFFCKESERSATTISIDRATRESKSPGISSRQSTSPQYFRRESKRPETAMSTDRETVGSKSSEWSKRNTSPRFFSREATKAGTSKIYPRSNGYKSLTSDRKIFVRRSTSPQFFCRESKRSGTTMNIDRKVGEPRSSYDRKVLKRSATPRLLNGKTKERSAITTSIDRKYGGFKLSEIMRNKRSTSPQFFCKESEKSATTMLIEPRSRSNSTKSSLNQRSSDTSYRRPIKSPIDKKNGFTKDRHTSSPSVAKHEVKKTLEETDVFSNITEARRSSKISETSATSSSSIVNLKYGLEFDNIFQSAGLVRKFMKSQDGKQRSIRQSPSKRNANVRIYARNNQSKNRCKTSSLQTARSPSIEGRKRATPEFSRKSITPTEVDMDIQEITMTDHRIERDKLQKASSPISKRQFDGTATQSTKREDRQRASSRSPIHMRNRSAESRAVGSPKVTSPDVSKMKKYPDTVSPILYDFAERRTKGARTKVDQLQNLRSARLVQGVVKDRNLSTNDEYNRGKEGHEDKNISVDEVDVDGIGVKYQTVVKTALTKESKDYSKIIRSNSADRITSKKVFLRETTPMKSSTSKKTISPTRECGRRHDLESKVSPRVSPLQKTAEISRGIYTPKIFSSQNIIAKTDQSSTFKFSKYTNEDRRRENVANKLAEFNKMSVKRKTEEPKNIVSEFSKTQGEDKYKKDLERMDSVESALRRFDSIGAEFEYSSLTNLQTSPDISLQTMDQKKVVKESIDPKGTIVPSRKVTDHTILKSTLKSPIGKNLKTKNVARKSDLRILKKETRSSKRPTRFGSSIESKQRSTKIQSPACKRRLFESDSEKEVQEERPKLSCTKARKDENCSFVNIRFRKDETVSNIRSSKSLDRDIAKESEETFTFSVKPLRSIEDIRKLIDNERNKSVTTEESRSAIANQRSASRENVDAKRSSPAIDAAKNRTDPARLTKIKSCVSRITKSPSPDLATTKQREMNARTTRGSTPSSPSKSPDVAPTNQRAESRNQEAKPSRRSTKGANSSRSKVTGTIDTVDGIVLQNGSPNESTKKSDAFMVDFDDRSSKEDDTMSKKSPMKKSSNKQQTASSASGRPTSSSNSSVNLIQDSSAKSRMESERGKGIGKGAGKSRSKTIEKPSSSNGKFTNSASFNEDAINDMKGLVKCKTCGRSFAQNRINLHEEICMKTTTKKRKQFDPVMNRVRGTELEPFVKKGFTKRETKTKKSETKSDWRRKHEEFINAIRYARETQARLAAGENLNNLPPPPPSDTSDYIQCEHCGRKFNSSAAERHIPICKRMHDKKQTQARARR